MPGGSQRVLSGQCLTIFVRAQGTTLIQTQDAVLLNWLCLYFKLISSSTHVNQACNLVFMFEVQIKRVGL